MARRGEQAEIKPRLVQIDRLALLEMANEEALLEVACGKGTYVRSLGRDIAKALGSCGHITYLRRTQCGPFSIKESKTLENLNKITYSDLPAAGLIPVEAVLTTVVWVVDSLWRVEEGELRSGVARALAFQRVVDGLVECGEDCELRPVVASDLARAVGPDVYTVLFADLLRARVRRLTRVEPAGARAIDGYLEVLAADALARGGAADVAEAHEKDRLS